MQTPWIQTHPEATLDHLGIIPSFIHADDERAAAEQVNDRYDFGGGWLPLKGWVMNPESLTLQYGASEGEDADPPLEPLFITKLRNELIAVYDYGWMAIIQKDGSFEVSRLD